jgi:hypothetical protein
MYVIQMNQATAIATCYISVFIAISAKRGIGITFGITSPDSFRTAIANGGQTVKTVIAHHSFFKNMYGFAY